MKYYLLQYSYINDGNIYLYNRPVNAESLEQAFNILRIQLQNENDPDYMSKWHDKNKRLTIDHNEDIYITGTSRPITKKQYDMLIELNIH